MKEYRAFPLLLLSGITEGNLTLDFLYLSTIDFVIEMPSLANSPTIRGEPQAGDFRSRRRAGAANPDSLLKRILDS